MKRHRDSPIQYEIMEGYVILKYNEKRYVWRPPMRVILEKFLNEDMYNYEIIHNKDGHAMFNVEDLRHNKDIFRQEVNPLAHKDINGWVKDE
jgi:hypothetical protein